jgi:PAS domain-containing protein
MKSPAKGREAMAINLVPFESDGDPSWSVARCSDVFSEEQWRAVFENNPAMYFMVDRSGTILAVNPLGAEHLSFTVDELVGRTQLILFHAEDRDSVESNTAICFERPAKR